MRKGSGWTSSQKAGGLVARGMTSRHPRAGTRLRRAGNPMSAAGAARTEAAPARLRRPRQQRVAEHRSRSTDGRCMTRSGRHLRAETRSKATSPPVSSGKPQGRGVGTAAGPCAQSGRQATPTPKRDRPAPAAPDSAVRPASAEGNRTSGEAPGRACHAAVPDGTKPRRASAGPAVRSTIRLIREGAGRRVGDAEAHAEPRGMPPCGSTSGRIPAGTCSGASPIRCEGGQANTAAMLQVSVPLGG